MPEQAGNIIRRVADAALLRGDVDGVLSVSVRQFLGSGLTTAVDVGLYYSLIRFGGVGILKSAALSFCVAVVMNYVISSAYVFRHLAGKTLWRLDRFVRFFLCALISLGLNQAVIWLISVRLAFHPLVGKTTAVAFLFFWNQWISRRVIFNGKVAEKTP